MPRHTAATLLTYEALADALGLTTLDVEDVIINQPSRTVAVTVTGDHRLPPRPAGTEAVVVALDELITVDAARTAEGKHR